MKFEDVSFTGLSSARPSRADKRRFRRVEAGFALAILLATSTGCPSVGPGDYRVFRVGISSVEVAPECFFPEEEPPADLAEDTNTFFTPETMVIYFGVGDRILLDAQDLTYEGGPGGDGFVFTAFGVDVSYLGANNDEAQVTITTESTVNITLDGAAVAGDFVSTDVYRCEFLTATPSDGLCEDTPDCVRRATFSGVEVDDVAVVSSVDDPNPF